MTHSLTLEIPEGLYRSLAERAARNGKKIEEIALEKLSNGDGGKIEDPFKKFIGSFDGGGMDWGRRHDEYLGEALMREVRGEKDE